MASVNFLLRSSKVNDPFTARLQFNNPLKVSEKNPFGLDFVESKTDIYVRYLLTIQGRTKGSIR